MLFPWYTKYPYQNDEVLNLDWIIKNIDNLVNEVANFVSLNTIKYADPIQWNITTQYEKNTVVVDPVSGSAYISTKPVPSGVTLSNDDYWTIIFNYASALNVLKKAVTKADEGDSAFATTSYSVGDSLWVNDILYLVIRPIASGDGFISDVDNNPNIQSRDLDDLIHFVHFVISNRDYGYLENSSSALSKGDFIWWKNALCVVTTDIPVNGALEGSVESTTIAAELAKINKRFSTTLTLNDLIVSGTTDLKETSIDGDLEVSGDINITGTYKQNGQSLDTKYSKLQGKKILILGDSIEDPTASVCYHPNWAEQLTDELTDIADVTINAQSGRKFIDLPNVLTALGSTYLSQFDIVIIALGTNDFGGGVEFAQYYTDSDTTKFNVCIRTTWQYLRGANDEVEIYYITPFYRLVNPSKYSMQAYRECIKGWVSNWHDKIINGEMVEGINRSSVADGTDWYTDSQTHPAEKGATAIYKHVLNSLLKGGDGYNENHSLVATVPYNTSYASGNATYWFEGQTLVIAIDGTFSNLSTGNNNILDFSNYPNLIRTQYGRTYAVVSGWDGTVNKPIDFALLTLDSYIALRPLSSDFDASHNYSVQYQLRLRPSFCNFGSAT